MFKNKNSMKKFWIVLSVIIVLIIITMLMQAQMLMMLQDLQTWVFGDYKFSNPLPPVYPVSSNPLPPVMPQY